MHPGYEFEVAVQGYVPERNYKPRHKVPPVFIFTAEEDDAASRSTMMLLARDYARNMGELKGADTVVTTFISVKETLIEDASEDDA